MTKDYFKYLFDKHFDKLRNYVYYRCGDAELSTDIVQDTFLKLWEKQLKPKNSNETALLYKIANDLFISQYRKNNSRLKFEQVYEQKVDSNTPEELLAYNELKLTYESCLSQMDEKTRVIFLMNRNDALTYKEISKALNISQKTVEKRMQKALNKLKVKIYPQ